MLPLLGSVLQKPFRMFAFTLKCVKLAVNAKLLRTITCRLPIGVIYMFDQQEC